MWQQGIYDLLSFSLEQIGLCWLLKQAAVEMIATVTHLNHRAFKNMLYFHNIIDTFPQAEVFGLM